MATKKRNPNGSGNITQRKDGRYELKVFVDSPDGRRKRISVYASTWEDANAERTRLKDLQRKGIPIESTTSTVGQYMRTVSTLVCRTGTGQTEAAGVAGATHSRVAERIADNLSVLCTGERRRAGDEGQGAVLREESCRVLRAGRGYRYVALSAPTCACGTARRRRGGTAGSKCCPTGQDANRLHSQGDALVGG